MSYRLRIPPEAEADMSAGFIWHEERGLGRDFVNAIVDKLHQIRQRPRIYPLVHRDVRRALVPRFHYAILFVLEAKTIAVLAIVHQARSPASWRGRRP